jgi:RimJ/RimL family protein N-acetyltransferase
VLQGFINSIYFSNRHENAVPLGVENVMLKQIYILVQAQKIDSETVKKWEESGLDVVFLENEYVEIASGDRDALLITDLPDERLPLQLLKLPRIGCGLDYSGNAAYIIEETKNISAVYLNQVYCRFYGIACTVIETENLIIREMSLDDLDELYAVYGTLRGCEYIEPLYERKEEEEFTRNYIKNMYGFFGYGLWLVIRKEDGRIIGRAGIEHREINGETVQELGYLIGKTWQNRGYAKEACLAIIGYSREELGIERLYLCSHKENIPSLSLAEKLGFSCIDEIDGMKLCMKIL